MEHSGSNDDYYCRLYWAHALIRQYLITGRKHALIKKYALNKHVRLLTRLYGIDIRCYHGNVLVYQIFLGYPYVHIYNNNVLWAIFLNTRN